MRTVLTTTEAADLAGVAPTTVKRWADRGFLPSARTPGGHRRFERASLERILREQAGSPPAEDPLVSRWIPCLIGGRRHEVDGQLLEARSRLGAWHRVADELGAVLVEVGKHWECGRMTIADEHLASDCLARSLARIGDALPTRVNGPGCLLACAGDDEHTLGLSLAELCLRELGWTPLWLGRRAPASEVIRLAEGRQVAAVALSASLASKDETVLGGIAEQVGAACRKRGVTLVLGGSGAWPARPTYGVRLTSFGAFHELLSERSRGHD